MFLFAHSHNIPQLSVCVGSSNHGRYLSLKHFHSMEENKSGELIHREDSAFFISLPAQTQEMSAESHSAGKRKQAIQGRRLEVKIKEGFPEEAALGLDPVGSCRKDSLWGICHIRTQFVAWKNVP